MRKAAAMYCPRCATPNTEGAKFCRACGTDVFAVATVLAEQGITSASGEDKAVTITHTDWLKKRSKSARNAVQGSILLGTAVLIGVALGLFSNIADWIIIWTIFFGWMACWGVISLAMGIGAILEARMMSRPIAPTVSGIAPTVPLLIGEDPALITDPLTAPSLPPPTSVTEHTTESLRAQHPQQSN